MKKQPDRMTEYLIEEAATLPPGDDERNRLLAEIDALNDDARRLWLERSGSYEAIRSRLRDVVPPDDLVDALSNIPDTTEDRGRRRRRTYAGPVAAAAALLLLVFGFIAFVMHLRHDPFHELATLMVEDHENHPSLVVTSPMPAVIEEALNRAGTLQVRVPELSEAFSLVGGRLCKFDRAPLAYTRWDYERIAHSLYQLQRRDFSLPDGFATREIEIAGRSGTHAGYRVLLWEKDEFVYGLVCPHPSAVRSSSLPRG